MSGDTVSSSDAAKSADTQSRQRSSISFPYMDLNGSIGLAEAIHNHVGLGDCTDDQLAAWTDQSAKSSGFRVQVYAARIFGVLSGDSGKHRLTDLGRAAVDPSQARAAKAEAFLTVPLYKVVYDKYKGGVIPPAAALERDFVSLGVSEKQKDRARQVFERSAEQAGFFEHGKNRLVAPGVQVGLGQKAAAEPPPAEPHKDTVTYTAGGGGGGGGTGDPLIDALVKKLPPSGHKWPNEERKTWLTMIEMAFNLAYGINP